MRLRSLASLALGVAYAHIVVGAIVRISGSGMGCGEHWPDCNSALVPSFAQTATVIEYTHRLLAATLIVALVALCVSAYRQRASAFRPAALALGTAITAAGVGAVIVELSLSNPYIIVVHYGLAMLLLAALMLAAMRSGGLGAAQVAPGDAAPRTYRAARAGAVMAFIVVVFGALVANVPAAAQSCQGFPWCRSVLAGGTPLALQVTHRVLAVVLFFHLFGVALGARRRQEGRTIVLATRWTFFVVVLQVVVAAAMVELHLPAPFQSLHQAVGTLVWISAFGSAALARRGVPAATPEPAAALTWSAT